MNTGGFSSLVIANSIDGNTVNIEMIDLRIDKNFDNIELLKERVSTLEGDSFLLKTQLVTLMRRFDMLVGQVYTEGVIPGLAPATI